MMGGRISDFKNRKRKVDPTLIGETTYNYLMGKIGLECLPAELKEKVLLSTDKESFIYGAGAMFAAMVPYSEFINVIEGIKDKANSGAPIMYVENCTQAISAESVDRTLRVGGYVKAMYDAATKTYEKGHLISEADNVIEFHKRVPEALKDIIDGEDFTDFTTVIADAIKIDLRKDAAAAEEEKQADADLATNMGVSDAGTDDVEYDENGDPIENSTDDLEGEGDPELEGDDETNPEDGENEGPDFDNLDADNIFQYGDNFGDDEDEEETDGDDKATDDEDDEKNEKAFAEACSRIRGKRKLFKENDKGRSANKYGTGYIRDIKNIVLKAVTETSK